MKSIYRDADIRSLMQNKYHERMSVWLDASIPEFEDWPKSTEFHVKGLKTEGITKKFDKSNNVIV